MEGSEIVEFDAVAEGVAGGGDIVVSRVGGDGDAAVAGEDGGAGLGAACDRGVPAVRGEAEGDVYGGGEGGGGDDEGEEGEVQVEVHV